MFLSLTRYIKNRFCAAPNPFAHCSHKHWMSLYVSVGRLLISCIVMMDGRDEDFSVMCDAVKQEGGRSQTDKKCVRILLNDLKV